MLQELGCLEGNDIKFCRHLGKQLSLNWITMLHHPISFIQFTFRTVQNCYNIQFLINFYYSLKTIFIIEVQKINILSFAFPVFPFLNQYEFTPDLAIILLHPAPPFHLTTCCISHLLFWFNSMNWYLFPKNTSFFDPLWHLSYGMFLARPTTFILNILTASCTSLSLFLSLLNTLLFPGF